MNRDAAVYVKDMLECIAKIEAYTKNADEAAFKKDSRMQDSVMRRLEVIGEAAKHLPPEWTSKYPDIPWRDISGMRDVLIHSYFGITLERVWKVVESDLPPLKATLLKIKKAL